MVRDDGSTDKTVEKIYAFKDNRILLERGENIGFGKSFLTLLNKAPIDAQMRCLVIRMMFGLTGKFNVLGNACQRHKSKQLSIAAGNLLLMKN
jgi:glycosyltransferase involved in cell wall biosynthesis